VSLVIRGGIDVHLEYANVRVFGVLAEPVGLDEHVFGITSHSKSSIKNREWKDHERAAPRRRNAPLQAAYRQTQVSRDDRNRARGEFPTC
jgi:hypothetical protein